MRVDALDHFTIQFQHEAQHTVGSGMLRAEIDMEIPDLCLSHQFFAFSSPGNT